MNTGVNLKYMRECLGITQKELAQRSCLNLRTIQNYEQGVNDIGKASFNKLIKIALALECNIEDILPPCPMFKNYFEKRLDNSIRK